MSFFKLYKPRQFGHRFIYYDSKKEAQKEREKRLSKESVNVDSSFKPTIHRGSFREQAEKKKNVRARQSRQSNTRFIIILFVLMFLLYYLLR